MCAGAKLLWTVIQQSLKVCEPQCLRFQPFMITHFNTIIANFHDQFQHIRMRPPCCHVSFTHFPPIVQITLSSVKLCLPLSEVHCLYAPKLQCICTTFNYIEINIHAFYAVWGYCIFYYWHFISSWNKINVLHLKRILMFVIVLLVPINHEHGDCTVNWKGTMSQWSWMACIMLIIGAMVQTL